MLCLLVHWVSEDQGTLAEVNHSVHCRGWETTYLKQLLFMAGNRPPTYERREVSRRKEKLFLSIVLVVSNLKTHGLDNCGEILKRVVF